MSHKKGALLLSLSYRPAMLITARLMVKFNALSPNNANRKSLSFKRLKLDNIQDIIFRNSL